MAVNSTTYKVIYNTDGTTGPFAITFPVRLDAGGDADDIKVYYRTAAGVETDITSACTIAGLNVTLGTAYAAGGKIAIVREPELKQLSVYSYGTRFPASQFESDLDYAMFCTQKVESEIARGLRAPITDAAADLEIPNEEDRKGKFLYFNVDTGLPEAATGVTGVAVSEFMETVLDDADAGTALTTLGISAYAQTLLDDANAATAAATLSVYTKAEIDAAVNPTQVTTDQIGPKTGTADNDLIELSNGAVVINGTIVTRQQILYVEDRKTAGTVGGTFSSGAWRTRDLNTEVLNTIIGASLASNQVTLPAGTYWIEADAPALDTGGHVAQIYDTTNTAVLLTGTAMYHTVAGDYSTNVSRIRGLITLLAPAVLELQHICETTSGATTGFGAAANIGQAHNTYSTFKATRLA